MTSSARVVAPLIRACRDDGRTLASQRPFVGPHGAEALGRMAREREGFVAELQRLSGAVPDRSSGSVSWRELLREAKTSLWGVMAGHNAGDAIASCRRFSARTEARYASAMARTMPDEVRRVITAQRDRLRDEAGELTLLQF